MTPSPKKGKKLDWPKDSTAKSVTKTPPNAKKAKQAKIFDKETIQLFQAIEYSNVPIDHAAVARAVGIKTPAARMRHIRLMRAIRASLADTSGLSDDADSTKYSDSEIEVEETEEDLKAIGIRMMKDIQEMMGAKGVKDVEDTPPTRFQTSRHKENKGNDDEKEGENHVPTAEI